MSPSRIKTFCLSFRLLCWVKIGCPRIPNKTHGETKEAGRTYKNTTVRRKTDKTGRHLWNSELQYTETAGQTCVRRRWSLGEPASTHTNAHNTPFNHRCSPFRKQHFKVNTLTKNRDRGTKLLNYCSGNTAKCCWHPLQPAVLITATTKHCWIKNAAKKTGLQMRSICKLWKLKHDVFKYLVSHIIHKYNCGGFKKEKLCFLLRLEFVLWNLLKEKRTRWSSKTRKSVCGSQPRGSQ